MQVVLQRVSRAQVSVEGETVGAIARGLVSLVGVGRRSTEADARWLAAKTQSLRLFPDADGRMALSVEEAAGEVLVISQFTLYADVRKGRRPSFAQAAEPAQGEALYEEYCAALTVPVARGQFGALMAIDMCADGPVTIVVGREDGRGF